MLRNDDVDDDDDADEEAMSDGEMSSIVELVGSCIDSLFNIGVEFLDFFMGDRDELILLSFRFLVAKIKLNFKCI